LSARDFCDGNSQFVKIALSDGTFGPRGTLFIWTFSNRDLGMPVVFLPDGTRWTLKRGRHGVSRKGR
jgi:hypothetical protein